MDVDHVAPFTTPNPLTRGKLPDSNSILPVESSMIPSQAVHSDPATNMNVQGCGHPKFCQTVRQYLRDCRPDIVVFVEPRIIGCKGDHLIASLGFPYSHRIEANRFSGGIWIVWFESVKVDILLNHFQFVYFRITDKRCGSSSLATVIYGSPNATKRKALWSNLRLLAPSIHLSWVLLGDFNATVYADDQVNGMIRNSFTPPFRYLSSWSSHNDFSRMVTDNSVPSATLSETIYSFTKPVDTWNDTVYGYIGKRKRIVMARLCGIQKALCTKSSRFLSNHESNLLLDLESILDQEELLWRAIIRRQKQRITSLQLPNGEWCSNVDSLRATVADYFKTLFTVDVRPPNRLPSDEAFFKRSLAWANHYYACAAVGEKRCPARMQWHSCQSLIVNEYSRFSTLGYVLQWSLPAAICIPSKSGGAAGSSGWNLFGQRLRF
ncbi:hypothetical protein V6N13_118533 [Hibiscus sabdariffa]